MGLGLGWIPLLITVSLPILIFTCYGIAVGLDHIVPYWAYISDSGTLPPELCVFAMGLSLMMILGFLFAYIRYKQVETFLMYKNKHAIRPSYSNVLNVVAFVFGIITTLGIGVVGAFQETNLLSVHVIGAGMAFGIGSVYFILQGVLSKRMVPHIGATWLAYLRMIVGYVCIVLYIVCQGSGLRSIDQFKPNPKSKNSIPVQTLKWRKANGGWEWRITSIVTEWIMAGFFLLWFGTWIMEFKRITYTPAKFEVNLPVTPPPTRASSHSIVDMNDDQPSGPRRSHHKGGSLTRSNPDLINPQKTGIHANQHGRHSNRKVEPHE